MINKLKRIINTIKNQVHTLNNHESAYSLRADLRDDLRDELHCCSASLKILYADFFRSMLFFLILCILSFSFMPAVLAQTSVFSNSSENSSNFNIAIDLPKSYLKVNPGTSIWFTINLLNLGSTNRKDVTLKYSVISPSGAVIVEKSKTVAIQTQSSFVADLEIPASQTPGRYNLNVVVVSDSEGTGSHVSFSVVRKSSDIILYIVVASLVLLAILVFALLHFKDSFRLVKMRMKISRIVVNRLKDNHNATNTDDADTNSADNDNTLP
jgi:flagellar basal body-associated protein FliL